MPQDRLQTSNCYCLALARPGAYVLSIRLLEHIFEVLVLMEIIAQVLIFMLNVLKFYEYIWVLLLIWYCDNYMYFLFKLFHKVSEMFKYIISDLYNKTK